MDIWDAIKGRRSIRRFERKAVSQDILVELVEAGRCAPSAANHQPLEYVIVDDEDCAGRIFEQLAWAGYVKPDRNPSAEQRPAAYSGAPACYAGRGRGSRPYDAENAPPWVGHRRVRIEMS